MNYCFKNAIHHLLFQAMIYSTVELWNSRAWFFAHLSYYGGFCDRFNISSNSAFKLLVKLAGQF
jgi:hypothetical protein